jgi:hypothetical protein
MTKADIARLKKDYRALYAVASNLQASIEAQVVVLVRLPVADFSKAGVQRALANLREAATFTTAAGAQLTVALHTLPRVRR